MEVSKFTTENVVKQDFTYTQKVKAVNVILTALEFKGLKIEDLGLFLAENKDKFDWLLRDEIVNCTEMVNYDKHKDCFMITYIYGR